MVDREEEINKIIEMLKRKNEALMQRHKEVEADKKSAEKSGQSFTNMPEHFDAPRNDNLKRVERGAPRQSRAHMDVPEQDQNDDRNNRRAQRAPTQRTPRGRAAGRGANEVGRGMSRGRGGRRLQDYEAKRLENFRLMEEEIAQTPEENEDPSVPNVSRFLDDPRRRGDLEPEQRWKSTRHKGNYGGMEFDNVKRGMRGRGRGYNNREHRGRGRGVSRLQMSAEYTGKERRDQERWQAMREAADKEIMARSKNTEGRWRREWDAEKHGDFDSRNRESGGTDRYEDHNHRGGRGRRGSNRTRRGSRGSHGSAEHRNEDRNEETTEKQGSLPEESQAETTDKRDQEKEPHQSDNPAVKEDSKAQRPRKKQSKSPRHLVQQRAQTPSSKDGTEVWAQNSHHSDETGAEWKNGARRSIEQWLPSDEGNRNPAIDERMLEQQEDGATVYSQQLGRGWGSEKNIKAAKAWVIDTEKAGATKQKPIPDHVMEAGEMKNDEKKFGKMHTGRRETSTRKEDSRVKEVRNERTEARSLSPRLKRGNPGLTVEIRKDANDRRVKRYSEGDSIHPGSESKDIKKSDTIETVSSPHVTSPFSAGILKTPEGLKDVGDWATEMDMQSPTYESRQKELEKVLAEAAATSGNKPLTSRETSDVQDSAEGETVFEGNIKVAADEAVDSLDKATRQENSVAMCPTDETVVKGDTESADSEKANTEELVVSSSTTSSKVQSVEGDMRETEEKCGVEQPSVSKTTSSTTVSGDISVVKDSATDFVEEDVQKENTGQPVVVQSESAAKPADVTTEPSIPGNASLSVEKSDPVVASGNELDSSNVDTTDSNFKDAEEDIDDEFYECDENKGHLDATVKPNEESNTVSKDASEKVEIVNDSEEANEPAAATASDICKETVEQRLQTLAEIDGAEIKRDTGGVAAATSADLDDGVNLSAASENAAGTS